MDQMILSLAFLLLSSAVALISTADSPTVELGQKTGNLKVKEEVHNDTPLTFHPDSTLDELWEAYKLQHGKSYPSLHLELSRKLIFVENLEKIWKHNDLYARGLTSFTLGVNQFTDMSEEEFVSQLNGLKIRLNSTDTDGSTYMTPLVNIKLPDTVDWRTQGYVTQVKDQGQCGSCWTFSTTGTLEGQHFRKTRQLVSLSEQHIVDCASRSGCSGGWEEDAYKYIIKNKGIDTESSYPYEAKNGLCRFNAKTVGATMTGYTKVPQGSESLLKEAVATVGPISVNIDAGHSSFQSYKSGIYDEPQCSTTALDHAVLIVGYGTMNGRDYWLVKNSWGTTWGTNGYIYMSRNKNNQCGIASSASYPLV